MYKVEIENSGGSDFRVKSKDYEFIVDTKGKGVTPPDALLASLATCLGVYIRKYFEGAKINCPGFKIGAEADFSKEPPFCFRAISLSVQLEGVTLDERRKKSLLDFMKNCPVHNTLKADPQIDINIL